MAKKKRAMLAAMLLLQQILVLVFCADVIITGGVDIIKTLLPFAQLQVALMLFLFFVLLFMFVAISKVEKKHLVNDTLLNIGACGLVAIMWGIILYHMGMTGLFHGKEYFFFAVQLVVLVAFFVTHCALEDFEWRIAMSALVASQLVLAIILSFLYKNELFSPARIITMFLLMAAVMALYIWGNKLIGNVAAALVVVAQAIVSMVVFFRLNHSKHILSVAEALIPSKSIEQVLSLVMVVLVLLLAVAVALQFLGQFQIVGKLVAVGFMCVIVSAYGIVGGIEAKAEGSFGVDKEEATTTVDYSLLVLKTDPAETIADATSYAIGVHFEGREDDMREAMAKLEEQAGTKLQFVEFANLSELGKAFYKGSLKAAFLDRATAEDIDAEMEMLDEEWIFTELTKVIASVEVEFKVEQEEEPIVRPGGNVSENADLTIEPFVVYISGIDVYGSITTKSRSDVNVLMTVNPSTKEIALITTPRDAYVEIPGKTKTQRDKLTHAGNFGVTYSMATLEKLYGIPVDYFIRVNFTSMEDIVDLLGGVDVYSHYSFVARHGKYPFVKGINHMNGSQALSFARERKTVTGGDTTRGKHHVELVKGLFKKVTGTSVLMSYQSLMDTVADNFQTDISTAQIAALVAMQLGDQAEWHFTSYATTGYYRYEYCASYGGSPLSVCILNKDSVYGAAELMARVLNGEKISDGEYEFEE